MLLTVLIASRRKMQPCFVTRCIHFLNQQRSKGKFDDSSQILSSFNLILIILIFSQTSSFHGSLMPKNSQFVPPALPPKKQKTTSASNASLNIIVTPPVSPKISNDNAFAQNAVDEKLEIKLSPSNQSNDGPRISISVTPEAETVVLRKKQTEIVMDLEFILNLTLIFN